MFNHRALIEVVRLLGLVWLTSACTADLTVPSGIILSCLSNLDCPPGSQCTPTDGSSISVCVVTGESVCGNGVKETGEACDDGNRENGDYCSSDCLLETSVCGDGNPEVGEVCDHGGQIDGWYCNDDCLSFRKECGDDFVAISSAGRDGETCDQGSDNTDAYQLNRTCLTDCDGYGSYCGDGKHDVEAGEACDDGNSELDGVTVTNPDGNGCSATCSRLGSCGDGQVQYAFEDCDDGNTALEACSYGQDSCFVCDGSCAFAPGRTTYCGDGITQSEYEHCDGDTKPCTELSSGFVSGNATCSGCNYWDTASCMVNTMDPQEMVAITGGLFGQGGISEYHQTHIDDFWMDTYKVSVGKYRDCVAAGVCPDAEVVADSLTSQGINFPEYCNYNYSERDNHPMNCVTWQEASDYCAWAQKRIPTDAEWEKAARGTEGYEYPWGNSPPASCTHAVLREGDGEITPLGEPGCGVGHTWEVGSKPLGVSPYGVSGMLGNVEEWVADWYSSNYYCAGNSATYAAPYEYCDAESTISDEVINNPQGVPVGEKRIVRGFPWDEWGVAYWTVDISGRQDPMYRSYRRGFRCAKPAE